MASKGTVIEVHNNRAVIMTEQCEFREIRLTSPVMAGETILYSDEDLQRNTRYARIPALVASVLLCCLLGAYLLYTPASEGTYAYVSFDINPSLELSVNRDYRVTATRSLNQDGRLMLERVKITGSSLNRAVSRIVGQSCQDGYLDAEKIQYMTVSLYFPEDIYDPKFLDKLDAFIAEELDANNITANVFYFEIDQKTYDEALQKNVSPSRWIMWQAAKKSGFNYDLKGNLPWSDSRLAEIASGKAYRTAEIQARHSMEKQSGKISQDQPELSQSQYGNGMETSNSDRSLNRQFKSQTIDADSDQSGSSSATSMGDNSTTNPAPYQERNQGENSDAPGDYGGQSPDSSNKAIGSEVTSNPGGSAGSGSSLRTGEAGGFEDSSSSGGSGSGGSGGSAGSGGSGSSGSSGGSGR